MVVVVGGGGGGAGERVMWEGEREILVVVTQCLLIPYHWGGGGGGGGGVLGKGWDGDPNRNYTVSVPARLTATLGGTDIAPYPGRDVWVGRGYSLCSWGTDWWGTGVEPSWFVEPSWPRCSMVELLIMPYFYIRLRGGGSGGGGGGGGGGAGGEGGGGKGGGGGYEGWGKDVRVKGWGVRRCSIQGT